MNDNLIADLPDPLLQVFKLRDFFDSETISTLRETTIEQLLEEIIFCCNRLALIIDDDKKDFLSTIINIVIHIHERL